MAHWLAHPEEGACCELYATIALIAGESGTNDPTLHLCGNYSICETLPRGVDRDKDPGWSDRCQSETTRADGYVGRPAGHCGLFDPRLRHQPAGRWGPLLGNPGQQGHRSCAATHDGSLGPEAPVTECKALDDVAWLAVVNTVFAFTSWNRALRTPTAVESRIIDGTMPGQIVRLAWLFSSERLRWPPGLGFSVAAAGTYIVHIRRRQRRGRAGNRG